MKIVLAGLAVAWQMSVSLASYAQSLPPGSVLDPPLAELPREVFTPELLGGKRSSQSVFGDLLFGSPSILGPVARREGISCQTCHRQGASNPDLFVPGLSVKPGTFDTTSKIFNPKTDDGLLNALTVPSLRGVKQLGPYGHDGRSASLRDFTRNVIVNEFAGDEPNPAVLDALVAYMQDIAFLPNPRLKNDGRLAPGAAADELRGEALFWGRQGVFTQNGSSSPSCASCHIPSAGFVDHIQHDIGTGAYKTPTLRNVLFNAPYFHDGRFGTLSEVVDYKNDWFKLGMTPEQKSDLVAYLKAAGDGVQAFEKQKVKPKAEEIAVFMSAVIDVIDEENTALALSGIDALVHEVRELQEAFPERKDKTVAEGRAERARARNVLGTFVLNLRQIQADAEQHRWSEAKDKLRKLGTAFDEAEPVLEAAEPWSLFNPKVLERRRMLIAEMNPPS